MGDPLRAITHFILPATQFVRAFTSTDVYIIANSAAVLCLLTDGMDRQVQQPSLAGISRHLRLVPNNDRLAKASNTLFRGILSRNSNEIGRVKGGFEHR